MRPVNISFDQDIRSELLDAPLEQRGRREAAPGEQRHALVPSHGGAT